MTVGPLVQLWKRARRQRELLEQFESEAVSDAKTSPESEGFFAKVKEFWDGLGR